jgi:hypothetical protein
MDLAHFADSTGAEKPAGTSLARATVAVAPANTSVSMTVTLDGLGQAWPYEVKNWSHNRGALPQVGDVCLVAFDDVNYDVWVIAWEGTGS